MKVLPRFHNDHSGAVTVEWVVITAIAVVLALAIMALFGDIADGRVKVIEEGIAANL